MSSFFTLPSSQKKRKRTEPSSKQLVASERSKERDDESISGSDISDGDAPAGVEAYESSNDDEKFEDEDPAAKRVRLAEQYLANTQKEVLEDGEYGFDAAEVDQENLRRRMGERLQEDTGESKGKLYRWVAEDVAWARASQQQMRYPGNIKSFNGVAIQGQHMYAVSKDMQLVKWEMASEATPEKGRRAAARAKVVAKSRGNRKDTKTQHHHKAILCVAVSPDSKFVATGGLDKKLIIWDATTLKPSKVFYQHRDAVTALAFRRGTNQLFSASKDRTVKIWSLDELAYVETLFGHQDEIVDVAALAQEKCVSVGARDRTARLWKVVEESQLVFRGGGAPGTTKALERLKHAYEDDSGVEMPQEQKAYNEGSMDRIAMIDDDTFVTGSDNGSISLWSIHKKKAVFTLPLAHGVDPALTPQEASADVTPDEELDESTRGGKQARWITALRAIPFSDIVVSGSWDGYVRAWKISQDKRRIESLGVVGTTSNTDEDPQGSIKGIINDLSIVDKGDRGKDGVRIAAAIGKEHRLGRWKGMPDGKDRVIVFEVPKKASESDPEDTESHTLRGDTSPEDEVFGGFD